MKKHKAPYFLILVLFFFSCIAQKKFIDLSRFTKEEVKVEEISSKIDSSKLIKRNNNNIVQLSFFEIFDDSVLVYLNNHLICNENIYQKNNPYTSTGWSGLNLDINLNNSKNIVTIVLFKQKKYVQFEVSKQTPLYVIQHYNKIWYIRPTATSLNLR